MKDVWSEGKIGNLFTTTRFVRTAAGEGSCTPDGIATPRLVDIYSCLGRGGLCGVIITGHAFVCRQGIRRPRQIAVDRDECIRGLSHVAYAGKADGSRMLLQISHAGIMSPQELTGLDAVGPSGGHPFGSPGARAMTDEEIAAVPGLFANAARRAQEAGFNGVQLHAAHGFLLHEFLSPYFNQRTDEYGGDQTKRSRLAVETVQAVRKACGPDFIIAAKFSAFDDLEAPGTAEPNPLGMTVDQCLHSAQLMENAGLDLVEVSGGICANKDTERTPMKKKFIGKGFFLEHAKTFHQRLNIPIIAIGGIRSLETAQEVMQNDIADFVGLCRPLIRDSLLLSRWKNGISVTSDCRSCNSCLAQNGAGHGMHCPLKI